MRVMIVIGLLWFGLGLPMQGQQLRWLTHPSGRPVMAFAVSGDGQVVVGHMPVFIDCPEQRPYYIDTPFRWIVSSNRVEDLLSPSCPDSTNSSAFGVSFSGDVIVGVALGSGFRWEAEVQSFTYWYSGYGAAFGVSGDGRVVVGGEEGYSFRQAFRHVWGQPVERLGTLGGNVSAALDASYDGSVVVGRAQNAQGNWRAFRWTAETGMQDLGVLFSTHWAGRANAVSADGTTVVGWTHGYYSRAFRWTLAAGMQPLNTFPDGGSTFAQDVSADGQIVVGYAQRGMEEHAVRWRADGSIEDLNIAFASLLGSGEVLRQATGVSADGRYIVGWGERNGVVAAFWLDTHITGDVDGNGCVDDSDLLRVLFAFGQTGSGLPEDVNGDEVVDDADLLIVLLAFGSGC